MVSKIASAGLIAIGWFGLSIHSSSSISARAQGILHDIPYHNTSENYSVEDGAIIVNMPLFAFTCDSNVASQPLSEFSQASLQTAVLIAESLASVDSKIHFLQNTATSYACSGDIKAAATILKQTLTAIRTIEDISHKGSKLVEIASIYRESLNDESAMESILEEAIALIETTDDSLIAQNIALGVAREYAEAGQTQKGINILGDTGLSDDTALLGRLLDSSDSAEFISSGFLLLEGNADDDASTFFSQLDAYSDFNQTLTDPRYLGELPTSDVLQIRLEAIAQLPAHPLRALEYLLLSNELIIRGELTEGLEVLELALQAVKAQISIEGENTSSHSFAPNLLWIGALFIQAGEVERGFSIIDSIPNSQEVIIEKAYSLIGLLYEINEPDDNTVNRLLSTAQQLINEIQDPEEKRELTEEINATAASFLSSFSSGSEVERAHALITKAFYITDVDPAYDIDGQLIESVRAEVIALLTEAEQLIESLSSPEEKTELNIRLAQTYSFIFDDTSKVRRITLSLLEYEETNEGNIRLLDASQYKDGRLVGLLIGIGEYESAVAIAQAIGEDEELVYTIRSLVRLEQYDSARQMTTRITSSLFRAEALMIMANAYEKLGQADIALAFVKEAINAAERYEPTDSAAENYHPQSKEDLIIDTLWKYGQTAENVEHIREAAHEIDNADIRITALLELSNTRTELMNLVFLENPWETGTTLNDSTLLAIATRSASLDLSYQALKALSHIRSARTQANGLVLVSSYLSGRHTPLTSEIKDLFQQIQARYPSTEN